MSTKRATTIRLSEAGRAVCVALSARLGLDRSAIVELAIRRLATLEGLDPATIGPAPAHKPAAKPKARPAK